VKRIQPILHSDPSKKDIAALAKQPEMPFYGALKLSGLRMRLQIVCTLFDGHGSFVQCCTHILFQPEFWE
jgi:hypothetical protein